MIIRATSDLHLTQRSAVWVFEALEQLRADDEEHGGEPELTAIGWMLPYLQPDKFWGAIKRLTAEDKTMKGGETKVWWTHQGWRGSYLNNMRRDNEGLSCKRVTADLVVSGHYHLPQNLGPIIYCGSPYETSFAEEGQVKGWLQPKVPKRVPYQISAPKHWTVLWDLADEKPTAPAGMKQGDKVRVIVNGTRDEVKKRPKALKQAGLEGAAIVADPRGNHRRVIDINTTAQDAAIQFIDRIYGPDEDKLHPANLHLWADEVQLWQS